MAYDINTHTISDIPARGAAAFGDAPALVMLGGKSVSYRELERFTRRAAASLRSRGVQKGDPVVILSENRPEWGVASFGVARSGAVAVPILADFPTEQVGNIIFHSQAKAIIASARFRRKLEALAITAALLPIEELIEPGDEVEGFSASEAGVRPEDLAAIVYTSGTTGRSKGVMLTQRNLVADALACSSVIVLDTNDVLLSILPLAHTYEYTIGFLIPTMSGACINYLDKPPSATVLLPTLARLRPTIVLSVPLVIEKIYRSGVKPNLEKIGLYRVGLFRPLLQRLAGGKLKSSFGGRIRFFGIGGAPLDPEVERFLLAARFPYAIGYGLTETAPIIAASAVGKTRLQMAGPPLKGADIRIASAEYPQGCPAGEIGEIQVRGPMVGPGYYRDEERSAEAFTLDGYFRTGDLGCFDKKHRLYVRGRLKTMILGASGENIYPEEVEAVLNSSPFVAESLVYGDDAGLTALVMLKPEIMDELGAYVLEGLQGAEKAATRFGQQVGAAIKAVIGQAGAAEQAAEKAAILLLGRVRKEANEKLAAFSRIGRVERQVDPFEKTPTQKIKRFLYQGKAESKR